MDITPEATSAAPMTSPLLQRTLDEVLQRVDMQGAFDDVEVPDAALVAALTAPQVRLSTAPRTRKAFDQKQATVDP